MVVIPKYIVHMYYVDNKVLGAWFVTFSSAKLSGGSENFLKRPHFSFHLYSKIASSAFRGRKS